MQAAAAGIHHITAIAGLAQANLDFYAGTLGLRLVKKTVNYDDPATYHFYFGDRLGAPGTILTFFPTGYPAPRGSSGAGTVTTVTFAAPAGSRQYWADRLQAGKVVTDQALGRVDADLIAFRDPDGLRLEIAFGSGSSEPAWEDGPVPAEHAIRGFHSATITVREASATAELLTGTLGFALAERTAGRSLYAAAGAGPGRLVRIEEKPGAAPGRMGPGTVHHIAWRTADDASQAALLERLRHDGHYVSPVTDRNYFHSIYFREPGGVLFEVATDPPGFTVDENP